ncbi:mechanosensitive ion channel family protein [Actinotalea sp. C106]|uniref:mechanosensitive ion channel family protein n=1 Tax=Actinotalea sp. C106 TaxID=2908644 RepID=UPI002028566B|nr:mechanosensitive ion channel domain-containing protein [Actinotalea sp. C106]
MELIDEIVADVLARAGDVGTRLAVAVLIALVVIGVGRLLRPLVRRGVATGGRPSRTRVFVALFQVVVVILAILLAATLAFPSVRVADVLASLGIVSVAAGFAFKDVLENLLAGVLLLLRDPFKSGDQIRVGDHEGTVEGITIRETLLRTYDGQRVLLPNAQVYTSPLEVLTHYPATRSAFRLNVAADSDVGQVREVLTTATREALAGVAMLPDGARPPEVVVVGMERGAVEVEVRVWSGPLRGQRTAALDAAIPAALAALRAQDIALDQPTTVLLQEG